MAPFNMPMQALGMAPQPQNPAQPQMGAGVMPPTSPVQQPPQAGTQQDPMMQQLMKGTQQGQQVYGEQVERMRNLAGTVGELQQQQANLQMPKMGPQIDHGASTLHNIGQILLMAANMTGPGRAMNQAIYGPGKQAYATQSGQLAERIKGLQQQEQIEEQPMAGAAGLQYHPFQALGAEERGRAALTTAGANVMNAQTRQLAEQHKTVIQTEANRIREELGQGKIDEEAARTKMLGVIAQARNSTNRDIAGMITDRSMAVEQQRAAEQDFKTIEDHWAQDSLRDLLGMPPVKPVTPAGGVPRRPTTPAKENPKSSGGATHVWTPQGLQPVTSK